MGFLNVNLRLITQLKRGLIALLRSGKCEHAVHP